MDTIALDRDAVANATRLRIPGLHSAPVAPSYRLLTDLRSPCPIIPPRHEVSGEYCAQTPVKAEMGWGAGALVGGFDLDVIDDTFQTRVGPPPPRRPPV